MNCSNLRLLHERVTSTLSSTNGSLAEFRHQKTRTFDNRMSINAFGWYGPRLYAQINATLDRSQGKEQWLMFCCNAENRSVRGANVARSRDELAAFMQTKPGDESDEQYFGDDLPAFLGLRNVWYGAAVAVHFSFGPQGNECFGGDDLDSMSSESILGRYNTDGWINFPPPPPDITNNPCFPSSALVTLPDGTPLRIGTLKEGDAIVAATADGTLTTDTVSLLSIAKPEAEAHTFLTLTTVGGRSLNLTVEHHLPVGQKCCATLKQAKDVVVGETVWGVENKATAAHTVATITKTVAKGLHSPVMTKGGFPVVNGVVTAWDRIESVTLASYGLLSALETTCKATRTCGLLRRMFA